MKRRWSRHTRAVETLIMLLWRVHSCNKSVCSVNPNVPLHISSIDLLWNFGNKVFLQRQGSFERKESGDFLIWHLLHEFIQQINGSEWQFKRLFYYFCNFFPLSFSLWHSFPRGSETWSSSWTEWDWHIRSHLAELLHFAWHRWSSWKCIWKTSAPIIWLKLKLQEQLSSIVL